MKKTLIGPELSLKQVMARIDETAEKIVFVVDDSGCLLGVITDGDVRRWILKNSNFECSASNVMNANPIKLKQNFDFNEAGSEMKKYKIECLPIVDNENKVISALWWTDLFDEKPQLYSQIALPVVIMAGGRGTRLEPYTKVLPKALIPLGEKSMLEVIIEKFVNFGCNDFYLSVNYKANMIKAYFKDLEHGYKIEYLEEEDYYGTAGSLSLFKPKVEGAFFLSNCDILIDGNYSDIYSFHRDNNNTITIVSSMKNFKIPYGIIETGSDGLLKSIKEKPEFDFLVNTGMYIIESSALKYIERNRLYHMTELIETCMAKGEKIGVYPLSEKSWTDIGQMEELFVTLKKFGVK